MKKLLKIVAIIVLLLVVVSVIIILVNKARSSTMNKQYALLGTKIESPNFVIEEFKVAGKAFVLQSADGLHPDPLQESDALSYLRYDKVSKEIVLQTQEHVPDTTGMALSNLRIHEYRFNMEGKPNSHDSALHRLNKDERNTILLKDYIAPFQKWKEDKQEIYLRHFGIESFSAECLNPFSLGGINGSSECTVWDGNGYFNLRIANDTLSFRSPAGKTDVLFTEKHLYVTHLGYYKLPAALDLATPAFLLYTPNHEQHRIFIIRRKS